MADPKKMVRHDGSRVAVVAHPSWKSELIGLWVALRTDPYIVLLFPVRLAFKLLCSPSMLTRSIDVPRFELVLHLAYVAIQVIRGSTPS
jgi:hypothetical protein